MPRTFSRQSTGEVIAAGDINELQIAIEQMTASAVHVAQYGAVGDGTTDDTTAFNDALAALPARGGVLLVDAKHYLLASGISETKRGLMVLCLSAIDQRGVTARGAIFSRSGVGWVWTHDAPATTANETAGPHFQGVTFYGTATQTGGLRCRQVSYGTLTRCGFAGFTTGTGFMLGTLGTDLLSDSSVRDASWWTLWDCWGQDTLNHFDIGGSEGNVLSSNIDLYGVSTLNRSASGISGTGVGILLQGTNQTVHGGKQERTGTGIQIQSGDGCGIYGTRFESNGVDVHLNRQTDGYSKHVVMGTRHVGSTGTNTIKVDAFNGGDQIVGYSNGSPRTLSDSGKRTMLLGEIQSGKMGFRAVVEALPASCTQGDITTLSGKLYICSAANTWTIVGTQT